jgi:CDP-diacylglycerol--glycerol-3-phosphate 3-phosphatidyltransferase
MLITTLELIEEIIITFLLPEWKANVKGLYWIIKRRPGVEAR